MGPGPPPPPPPPHWRAWPRVHYACAATECSSGWLLDTREEEPPAKYGRQDIENDTEAVSDSSATLDSTLLSSSPDASALRSGGGTPPPAPPPPPPPPPPPRGPLAANRPAPNALAPPKFCSRSAPGTAIARAAAVRTLCHSLARG